MATLALVPVVAGASSASAPAAAHISAAAADLYGGLPDLPFPLELVALCMMRTLQRKVRQRVCLFSLRQKPK